MICNTADVTGSRQRDLFTLILAATEKLEKRDKLLRGRGLGAVVGPPVRCGAGGAE